MELLFGLLKLLELITNVNDDIFYYIQINYILLLEDDRGTIESAKEISRTYIY